MRTCKNCALWGETKAGGHGACCRLSCGDGILTVGNGVAETPATFGCNEFAARLGASILVMEGVLSWYYEDIRIGGVDLGVAFGKKFPDERGDSGKRYRWTIERLE